MRDGIPKGSHFTLLYPSGKRDGVHPSLRGLEAIGTVISQHLTVKIGFKWNQKYKKNDPILLHKFTALHKLRMRDIMMTALYTGVGDPVDIL